MVKEISLLLNDSVQETDSKRVLFNLFLKIANEIDTSSLEGKPVIQLQQNFLDDDQAEKINILIKKVCERGNLELERPFEGSNKIFGLVIGKEQDQIKQNQEYGFLRLLFEENTQDLPFHCHPHSDRFIIITKGNGHFFYSPQDIDNVKASSITKESIRAGTFIYFSQKLVHTFSTESSTMEFISFHVPYITIDDEMHFSLSKERITPEKLKI